MEFIDNCSKMRERLDFLGKLGARYKKNEFCRKFFDYLIKAWEFEFVK